MILLITDDECKTVLKVLNDKHEMVLDDMDRMLDSPSYNYNEYTNLQRIETLLDSVICKLLNN